MEDEWEFTGVPPTMLSIRISVGYSQVPLNFSIIILYKSLTTKSISPYNDMHNALLLRRIFRFR